MVDYISHQARSPANDLKICYGIKDRDYQFARKHCSRSSQHKSDKEKPWR